jgi:tetratricopeptide (TPR) repeat protein
LTSLNISFFPFFKFENIAFESIKQIDFIYHTKNIDGKLLSVSEVENDHKMLEFVMLQLLRYDHINITLFDGKKFEIRHLRDQKREDMQSMKDIAEVISKFVNVKLIALDYYQDIRVPELEKKIIKDPNPVDHSELARLIHTQHPKRAIALYKKAMEEYTQIENREAGVYFIEEFDEINSYLMEIFVLLEKRVRNEPSNPVHLILLAEVLINDPNQAIALYQEAIELYKKKREVEDISYQTEIDDINLALSLLHQKSNT